MQTLTKKEWIAIAIVLVIIVVFFGARFLMGVMQRSASVANTAVNTSNMDKNSTTTSGFVVTDVTVGTGAEAKAGNLVSVQYTGKFADGKVFDSSIPRGQPIQFVLGAGQVISGWDQGILGMKVDGKRTLVIPPELGYGPNGYPPVIPPNSTLYFDIELVAVQAQ